jgi:hypothetical protein
MGSNTATSGSALVPFGGLSGESLGPQRGWRMGLCGLTRPLLHARPDFARNTTESIQPQSFFTTLDLKAWRQTSSTMTRVRVVRPYDGEHHLIKTVNAWTRLRSFPPTLHIATKALQLRASSPYWHMHCASQDGVHAARAYRQQNCRSSTLTTPSDI